MDLKFKWKFNIKDLPDMKTLNHEVDSIAKDVTIGKTLFMEKYGVSSEREYKEKMMKEHKVMKHSAVGLNSWQQEEEGVKRIYNELTESGSYIDRYGLCLDWVMGVPEEYRSKMQAGSGLILRSEDEWARVGQVAPVQPHLGDHMTGSLNGLNNTKLGLKAGVTTIGNFSHYYTYEYPGLDMEEYRTVDMVKAIGLMYEKLIDKDDFRVASLYNNMSSVLLKSGDLTKGIDYLEKSKDILEKLTDSQVETATCY